MTKLNITVTDGHREAWLVYAGVGGYVCAEPAPGLPDGICSMPTESEPCPIHHPEAAAEAISGDPIDPVS